MVRRLLDVAVIGCLLSVTAQAASKVELRIQLGHAGGIRSIAFSADGRFLLTGGDKTARLWEVATAREIRRFESPAAVRSVALSPDGLFVLAGTEQHNARLWEVATGREIHRFECQAYCLAVAFSADGRWVLAGSDVPDRTARLWEAATGREVQVFKGHTARVGSVAISPDGRFVLTGSDDKTARLWDVATGSEVRVFQTGAVESVAFSPDGQSVFIGCQGNSRIWNAATGREIHRIGERADRVTSVAFSPDGRSVLGSVIVGDWGVPGLRLWDVASGRETRRWSHDDVHSVAFSRDGRSALTSSPTAALVWDTATFRETRRIGGFADSVASAAFASDGRSVLTETQGFPRIAQLWDATTGREIRRFKVSSATLSPDPAVVLTLTRGGTVGLSDAATGREIRQLHGSKFVDWAVFSPDGRSVITGGTIGDKSARLWDVATGREIRRFEDRAAYVRSVVFSPDGAAVLTGGSDNSARLWDVTTGRDIRRFEIEGLLLVDFVAFSPDGRLVLGSKTGETRLWDAATGREIRRFYFGGPLVFSPDGRSLLGRSQNAARLWDAETGREIRRFEGQSGFVTSATFSSDGRLVLTGSQDGTSRIWETATGRLMATLVSFRDGGWAVVDPEGRYDAADPENSPGLYWLLDSEVIELKQLKDRFYTPGLLARVLGFNREPLPRVAGLDQLQLSPDVEVAAPPSGQSTATVRLTDRGGGVGRVIVKVNGREIAQTARPRAVNPDARTVELSVDLSTAALAADGRNTIEVIPYDKANFVAGRGLSRNWDQPPDKPAAPPVLHVIIAGVSTYENGALNLTYPAKDATDIAQALEVGGRGLFGVDRVRISTFASGTDQEPTKDNIRLAFERVTQSSGPNDVLLVYFAGHGVAGREERDTYYFLTREARSLDLDTDIALRKQTTISSGELLEWLRQKGMPLKQVMVLDTCAAGAAATELVKLADRRVLTADQKRAIELLKDATGSHILMGSAADRVSYEASRYGQGLLTYALLLGMRGEALDEGGRLDVRKWFDTAQGRVPEFALGIGGIQQPVISSPRGQTFPIALLTADDRRRIPLPLLKPQLLRLQVLDGNDTDGLGLSASVRTELRAASLPATRGETRREPELVYLDQVSDDVPDAYKPQIRYTVDDRGVQLSIRLIRGSERVAERPVTLTTRDTGEISKRVVAELIQMLAGLSSK